MFELIVFLIITFSIFFLAFYDYFFPKNKEMFDSFGPYYFYILMGSFLFFTGIACIPIFRRLDHNE
jgi:Na+-driven multidrug efflux pump